jgi:spermidine synthase
MANADIKGATTTLQDDQPMATSEWSVLTLFVATMFVGAALLFWIQPMFAKMVLPLLGGSPAVWNTAMVFFQAALLAGYAYSHWLSRLVAPRIQIIVHLGVLASAFLVLPLAVADGWVPDAETIPVMWLLGLLAVSIGLPFFAVSATAPLMQRWFSHTGHRHAGDPYFLYGASNLGSMLGLLGFPLLLEPSLAASQQSIAWTLGYAVLAGLIALSGVMMISRGRASAATSVSRDSTIAPPTWKTRAGWIAYSAVPSALLLGVTRHITTDIAAAPLFWSVPLALYLLTFVIVFARRPIIPHRIVVRAFPFVMVMLASLFMWRSPVGLLLPMHLLAFFVTALMCHGELARRRPAVSALTEFYLFLSIGGVLGGTFTALLAPVLFNAVYEYPIVLAAACALLPVTCRILFDKSDILVAAVLFGLLVGAHHLAVAIVPAKAEMMVALAVLLLALVAFGRKSRPVGFALSIAAVLGGSVLAMGSERTLDRARSFFGVYRVAETDDGAYRVLIHGTTQHGGQKNLADGGLEPISYYADDGPIAELIVRVQDTITAPSIGIVGLGAGSLACYHRAGESWRFYEIDPVVARYASDGRYFGLVPSCAPDAPIVLGDARLTLARETETRFDLLVIDAFSSDAIPIHLLTREALSLYTSRLAAGGVLVIHVSNQYLDLRPVVARLASDRGLVARLGLKVESATAEDGTPMPLASSPSMWIALAEKAESLDQLALGERWSPLPAASDGSVWTDDYSNILEAIVWGGLDVGAAD